MTIQSELRSAIDSATTRLAEAGIDSARYDAEELAAHLAGTERGRLPLIGSPDDIFFDSYRAAIAARSRRVPLQHLTGTAAFGPLTLSVGPGVFIPRPETEAMLEWANSQRLVGSPAKPVIVDVCTGSGALALALARHRPDARVIGIDDSEAALDYARRNAGRAPRWSYFAPTSPNLACCPSSTGGSTSWCPTRPTFPAGAELEPEVLEHDPPHAVFGGPDGMAVIPAVVRLAGRWLRARRPVRRRARRHHVFADV